MRQPRDTDIADYRPDEWSLVTEATVTEADRYAKSVAGIEFEAI